MTTVLLLRSALNLSVAAAFSATLATAVLDAPPSAWPAAAALAALAATVPAVLATVLPRVPKDDEWVAKYGVKYGAFVVGPLLALSAHRLATLDVFVVAWGMAPWLFLPLYLLDEAGLVEYPVASGAVMLRRMLFYATVRAYAVAAERRLGTPTLAVRTLVLGMGTGETIAMVVQGVYGDGRLWYSFPIRSSEFATYALVKSVWLLSLPLLEEYVVSAVHYTFAD